MYAASEAAARDPNNFPPPGGRYLSTAAQVRKAGNGHRLDTSGLSDRQSVL